MIKDNSDKIISELKKYGEMPDEDLDMSDMALKISALQHPGISLGRYTNHLAKLVSSVEDRHEYLLGSDYDDELETRLAALKDVIARDEGYCGDVDDYDNIQNTDLIRVIDRRKGIPITLSLLYLHVARALGWTAYGLAIPGHFIVRLDMQGGRLLFDPYNDCKILEAPDLRHLIKSRLGPDAELSASYFEPSSNRAILIRLQNNIKSRLIENEDYKHALEVVEVMRLIAPDDYRVLFDAGVLYARTGAAKSAREVLIQYLEQAPSHVNCDDAVVLLQQINTTLN